ncbi:hypothetical protein [Kitasatospora purpeofusca]|uniref:hypothetical protein n=1 Tax=Kitasatospora purpeofusca TaxID=67352 RepID=UPI0036D3975C
MSIRRSPARRGIRPTGQTLDAGAASAGTSCSAIAARIRQQPGVAVPLDVFLDTPTARGVAAAGTDLRQE